MWIAQGAWPDPDLLYSYTPVGGSPPPKCGGPGVLEYCTGSFCDPVPRHSRTQAALWCGQSSLTSGTTVPQDLVPLWCLVVAAFTALFPTSTALLDHCGCDADNRVL